MAFTAMISSINPTTDGNSGVAFRVSVAFADSASGFSVCKDYIFPIGTTQASATSTITTDGNALKSGLASISNLASKVGTVITI